MKPLQRLAAASLAAYGLLFCAATHATDVSTRPLQANVLVKPTLIFGMDDSGSMDWEILVDSEQGLPWWDTNSRAWATPSGVFFASGTTARVSSYLFPLGNGTGGNAYAYNSTWGNAVPPYPQFAALRSSAFNPLYYNPDVVYAPWSPAYHNGALQTYGTSPDNAAKWHPAVAGSGTINLRANQAGTTTLGEFFEGYAGTWVPQGAKISTNASSWSTVGAGGVTLTQNAYISDAYYAATYWKRENCTIQAFTNAAATCVAGPNGLSLKLYEIKQPNYPNIAAYNADMNNFANWFTYYRKRKLMLAASMGQVMENLSGMRLGVAAMSVGAANYNSGSPAATTILDADAASAASNRLAIAGRFYTNPANSGTPTSETLKYIGEQFTIKNPNAVLFACQRNAAFIVTDGFANPYPADLNVPAYTQATYGSGAPYATTRARHLADVALSYFTRNLRPDLTAGQVPLGRQDITNPDPNPNIHMNTYAITLGARGNIWPARTDPFTGPAIAWPDASSAGNQDSIDDLWHATINGRGKMYVATSPEETAASIRAGVEDFRSEVGAQAAVAVSSVSLAQGDSKAYLGIYHTQTWSGDVTANSINAANGVISPTPIWSAATRLAAKNWTTRVIATHNGSTGVAFTAGTSGSAVNPGDVYGTTAEVMNYLRGDRSLEGTDFRTRASLMGAVVNAKPIIEATEGVVYAASSEGMLHALDSSTGDELWAYVPYGARNRIGASTQRSWSFESILDGSPTIGMVGAKKVLIGGLGAVGAGWYALDVTAPRGLSEAGLAGKVMWEFPGAGNPGPVGLSVGKAVIAETLNDGTVVLIPQGYNASSDGRGRVYVLNANTGALLYTLVTTVAGSGDPGLAQIAAMPEANGKVRYAYGGDERGNLWRFDLEGRSVARIAQLKDAGGNPQPVTTIPQTVRLNGERVILIGTGRLLGLSDFGSTQTQSFFAIKDNGPELTNARTSLLPRTLSAPNGLGQRGLTGATMNWGTQRGWYFDLPAGEQSNTDPSVAYGTLAFTTNKGSISNCGAESYLYLIDLQTGTQLTTATYAAEKLGNFLATDAVLLATNGTIANTRVVASVRLSSGQQILRGMNVGALVTPRKNSWRQIRRD